MTLLMTVVASEYTLTSCLCECHTCPATCVTMCHVSGIFRFELSQQLQRLWHGITVGVLIHKVLVIQGSLKSLVPATICNQNKQTGKILVT